MQKPIEPGCMCLVVGGSPSGVGESCTVIQWVNDGDAFMTRGGRFENNTSISGWAVEFGDGCGVFLDKNLRRIDGGDPDATQEETQDQEVPTDAFA